MILTALDRTKKISDSIINQIRDAVMSDEYKIGDKIGSEDIMIPSLPVLGVDEKTLEKLAAQMAEDAIASGSPGNNPRQATKDKIVELYRLAYAQ
jgi:alcohol dehydrogenase class IV